MYAIDLINFTIQYSIQQWHILYCVGKLFMLYIQLDAFHTTVIIPTKPIVFSKSRIATLGGAQNDEIAAFQDIQHFNKLATIHIAYVQLHLQLALKVIV